MQSDEILIAAVANGDESAFEELVDKNKLIIFNLINQFLNNHTETEDLAQEVFIKVWRYARTFNPKYKFSTWIYRITVNTCLNYRKSRKSSPLRDSLHENEISDIINPDEKQPDKLIEIAERNSLITQTLLHLPPNQRMALILSQFEERSYKDIADIMEITVPAVESLIFRAKSYLKDKLLPLKDKYQL